MVLSLHISISTIGLDVEPSIDRAMPLQISMLARWQTALEPVASAFIPIENVNEAKASKPAP